MKKKLREGAGGAGRLQKSVSQLGYLTIKIVQLKSLKHSRHTTSRGRPVMVLFWSRYPGP